MIREPGSTAYLGSNQVVIVGQVLFNRPAYRVIHAKDLDKKKKESHGSFVVDGNLLKGRPSPGIEEALKIMARMSSMGLKK